MPPRCDADMCEAERVLFSEGVLSCSHSETKLPVQSVWILRKMVVFFCMCIMGGVGAWYLAKPLENTSVSVSQYSTAFLLFSF